MNLTPLLAMAWYKIVLALGLVGVIVFYILYRRSENQ